MSDIDRQFRQQRQQITSQVQQQRENVERQAREQRERVQQAAREARETLRRQKSELERQVQEAKGGIRTEKRREGRKRDLPITKPIDVQAEERIASVEGQEAEIKGEIKEAEKGVAEAEQKDIEAIATAETEAKTELAQAEAKALSELKKAEAEFNQVIGKLDSYKIGDDYNLAGYLRDNPSVDTAELLTVGFTQTAINNAITYNTNSDKLAPYKSDEGYDVLGYLIDNPKADTGFLVDLFGQETVSNAIANSVKLALYKSDEGYDVLGYIHDNPKADTGFLVDLFGQGVVNDAITGSNKLTEWEVDLKTSNPALYQIYEKSGVDAYNDAVKQLESLPTMTVASPAAQAAIDAATRAYGRATIPETVKSGDIPATLTVLDMGKIDASTVFSNTFTTLIPDGTQVLANWREQQTLLTQLVPYKTDTGYNLPKFIKDNPTFDTDKLVTVVGFEQKDVDAAIDYSQRPFYKESPGETLFTAIQNAIESGALKFDNAKVKAEVLNDPTKAFFTQEWRDYYKTHPAMRRLYEAAFVTEDWYKTSLTPTMELIDFTTAFIEARPDSELPKKTLEKLAEMEYAHLYGQREVAESTLKTLPQYSAAQAAKLYDKIDATLVGDAIAMQAARGALTGAVDLVVGTITLPLVGIAAITYTATGQPAAAGQLIVNTGIGIKDYFVDLVTEVFTTPASGLPRAIVALAPIIFGGVKAMVRVAKGGVVKVAPHGVPARGLAVEVDVSRIPFERAGYETTLRAVGEALEQQLKTQVADKSYVGKVVVRFSDRVLELSAIMSDKLHTVNTPLIRALNVADAVNIPTRLAKVLTEYIKKNDGRVSGSFVDWLHLKEVARPNDIDISFSNQARAISDIVQIARDAGYKAKAIEHGVVIQIKGKWVKICDVDSIAHHNSMLPKSIKPQPAQLVDGIRVEIVGEQLARLSQAVLTAEKLGAALTDLKYYSRIEPLVKHIAEHLKDPGLVSRLMGEVELTYRRSPLQVLTPDTLYHATPDVATLLKELKTKGYITLTQDLFTSPQVALDFLRRSARGVAPVDPGVIAIRTANLRGFRMPSKAYMGAVEAEIVGKVGVKLYPTSLNWYGKVFGERLTGKTFTQYEGASQTFKTTLSRTGEVIDLKKPVKIKSGQLVPVYWLKTAGAKGGVPSIGQLYAATGMAFVESLRDVPYLRLRRIKFSFYGGEGAASPFRSTRTAYDIVVKVTKRLEAEATKNVRRMAKETWTEADYARAFTAELDRLVKQETARLSKIPEIRDALKRDRAIFEQAYTINLAKYYTIMALGAQGRLRGNTPIRERPDIVTNYRYSNGELTRIGEERARGLAEETRPLLATSERLTPIAIEERVAPTPGRSRAVLPPERSKITPIERRTEPTLETTRRIETPPPRERETPPPRERERIPPRERETPPPPEQNIIPPFVKLPDGSERPLTPEELAGAVGYKQGWLYRAIFPPYGEHDVIHSRKPVMGIPYFKGAKSAYRSIIRRGGKLPPTIARDMGIFDVIIESSRYGKPRLIFKPDVEQKTRVTGKVVKRRKSKSRVAPEVGLGIMR